MWAGGLRFGVKNFRNHMHIQNNVTLKGILRRTVRRYPRTTTVLTHVSFLAGFYFIAMSLVPGSSMPLQTDIKLSILLFSKKMAKVTCYGWFFQDPGQYMTRINEILLGAFDKQIFRVNYIESQFRQIKEVAQESERRLKHRDYWDLLIYGQMVLQNIVQYEKRLLLENSIYSYYEWLLMVCLKELKGSKVQQRDNKTINLIYSVIQYLINFSQEEEQTLQFIKQYQNVISIKADKLETNQFQYQLMQKGIESTAFKQCLKSMYGKTQKVQLKQTILTIFETLDRLYQAQQKKKPKRTK